MSLDVMDMTDQRRLIENEGVEGDEIVPDSGEL